MPQNDDRKPASGSSIQNAKPNVFAKQRIGIGADRVEGDVAEIEQAGEADHDIEAPAEHHVDQNLDAEIVDPFQRAAESGGENDNGRIDDDKADGEGDEPFRQITPPCRPRGLRRHASRVARATAASAKE